MSDLPDPDDFEAWQVEMERRWKVLDCLWRAVGREVRWSARGRLIWPEPLTLTIYQRSRR